MMCLGVNTVSLALDQKPPLPPSMPGEETLNDSSKDNISVRESNPQKWKISFVSNGSLPGKQIVKFACESIISRLQIQDTYIKSAIQTELESIINIPGETHTIALLFMKTCTELFPEISITYSTDLFERMCSLKIRLDAVENSVSTDATTGIADMFQSIIDNLVDKFSKIKETFE